MYLAPTFELEKLKYFWRNECKVWKVEPVLDVSFSATKPWSVNSESNSFEPCPFSSSHKLSNNIPVLVHLEKHIERRIQKLKTRKIHYHHSMEVKIQHFKLTYSWKKRMPGPVEATSSTLEVAHEDKVWNKQRTNTLAINTKYAA